MNCIIIKYGLNVLFPLSLPIQVYILPCFPWNAVFLLQFLMYQFGQKLNKDTETENIQKYFKQANKNVIDVVQFSNMSNVCVGNFYCTV
jgi:hypothetical protein